MIKLILAMVVILLIATMSGCVDRSDISEVEVTPTPTSTVVPVVTSTPTVVPMIPPDIAKYWDSLVESGNNDKLEEVCTELAYDISFHTRFIAIGGLERVCEAGAHRRPYEECVSESTVDANNEIERQMEIYSVYCGNLTVTDICKLYVKHHWSSDIQDVM